MKDSAASFGDLSFFELQDRFGLDNARSILRTLEQFEGILEHHVAELSEEDRLNNVISTMKDNINYQTRH